MFRLFLLTGALVVTQACTCQKPPPVIAVNQCKDVANVQADRFDACTDNSACAEHYSCRDIRDQEGLKCCVFADRACATEADCCPGQTCNSDRKKCFDKKTDCTTDADCGSLGDATCVTVTGTFAGKRCQQIACGAAGECPEGLSCFQGDCVGARPCNGTCPAGAGCVPSYHPANEDTVGFCQDYKSPTDRSAAACPMTCSPGFLATFKDNRNLWDTCKLPDVSCLCAELPTLRSEDLGRYSAIAADPGKNLYVSEYDGQYGDLAVAQFDLTGKRLKLDYVDGVPAAAVEYGPSGARGGVVEPGDDVGRYTDIAVRSGLTYVSYYDLTHGDLKLAIRNTDGRWSSQRVDGLTADLGLYTSIAIDSDGYPGISYFQRAGEAGFMASECPTAPSVAVKYITALKFARATKAVPMSPGDWQIKTVACLARPAPACDGCAAPNVCADTGNGPECRVTAMGCTPACDMNTEKCVTEGATKACGKNYNPALLLDVPMGVGVFSSLTFQGKEALIAYMKRSSTVTVTDAGTNTSKPDGDLYAVRISATNAVGAPVLLDGSGDTGYFPDIRVDPNGTNIAVAYHDFTSKSLKFYYAPALQTGVTPEVIDRGIDPLLPGEQSFVGTDTALVFGASAGQVWALYQDATRGDLKLAKRGSSWVVQPSPATAGAVGFFVDAVLTDGKIYASHARYHAKLISDKPHVDHSLQLEQLPAN